VRGQVYHHHHDRHDHHGVKQTLYSRYVVVYYSLLDVNNQWMVELERSYSTASPSIYLLFATSAQGFFACVWQEVRYLSSQHIVVCLMVSIAAAA
jgi:hypothetical protein